MGRPNKMTDLAQGEDLVSTVSYNGPAGEISSMSGTSVSEARTYNSMGQLLTLSGLNGVNLRYNYPPAGANNGQIQSQQDVSGPSGETITYAYDSLKRLSSATSSFTNQQAWSQNYGYDGFGNLVTKLGTGMAQNTSYPTDSTKNWLWTGNMI